MEIQNLNIYRYVYISKPIQMVLNDIIIQYSFTKSTCNTANIPSHNYNTVNTANTILTKSGPSHILETIHRTRIQGFLHPRLNRRH